ncbi:hypothetical protein H0I29_00590 [Polaribacter sp. R2A056_3_33]|uniref:DUF6371 domain-containing protein n=1 Tax=Polaribacter sp. R2A056_3_33 TaxID=2745563 RepID=UPI001C4E961B|nr:DUF6371 domain-containing protein [Polaribacter sp. R2A056_3_33]QXP70639.1 hypothetical protein H0I29_00590 [Polaribacter sp. R2A056_3_33]
MKHNYKYSLDRSSRKFICPNCHKKTFVKFIDNETNLYLNSSDGRCDRESKCGYFKKPTSNCITNINNCITEVIQPSYHNRKVLQEYCNTKQQSNFISYLLRNFEPKMVSQAIDMYHIGTTNYWYGATIFWLIDTKNVIRGGKIMLYNCNTGKRVKKPFNHVSWIHKQLKLNNFVLQQCLFGLHLINSISKSDTICIVESEKTAIIMSIMIPNFIWLATGSKTGFKEKMLKSIKEFNVIAYPDKTVYSNWNKEAILLNKQGYKIECSNLLESIELENGGDLVDFLL